MGCLSYKDVALFRHMEATARSTPRPRICPLKVPTCATHLMPCFLTEWHILQGNNYIESHKPPPSTSTIPGMAFSRVGPKPTW